MEKKSIIVEGCSLINIINQMNVKHYWTHAIIKLFQELSKHWLLTTEADRNLGYGTHELTRKLLRQLQELGLLKSEKNVFNEYRWSLTELGFEKLNEYNLNKKNESN